MYIDLNRNSNIPLSIQIYQAIADRIASGLIEKGTKLLSARTLSKSLKVSLVTVVKAYSILGVQQTFPTNTTLRNIVP